MKQILRAARRFWSRLFSASSRPYRTVRVENIPKQLDVLTIYLVGEDGILEHVSMLCPCRCGDIVNLNLLPDERPLWSTETHGDGTVSLFPSVRRTKGCRAHYWVKQGHIKWAELNSNNRSCY